MKIIQSTIAWTKIFVHSIDDRLEPVSHLTLFPNPTRLASRFRLSGRFIEAFPKPNAIKSCWNQIPHADSQRPGQHDQFAVEGRTKVRFHLGQRSRRDVPTQNAALGSQLLLSQAVLQAQIPEFCANDIEFSSHSSASGGGETNGLKADGSSASRGKFSSQRKLSCRH